MPNYVNCWRKNQKGRFHGEIDRTTGAYRRLDETFPEDDVTTWMAMREADPNIVQHMLDAYDKGEWRIVSGLQSWLRENWRERYALKPISPTVGIPFRACVAQRPALLKRIFIQRLGENTQGGEIVLAEIVDEEFDPEEGDNEVQR